MAFYPRRTGRLAPEVEDELVRDADLITLEGMALSFAVTAAGLSVADVAYRLEYSSPQSFGRHVRSLLGITSTEFRHRFPFPIAVDRFIRLLIEPYAGTWGRFHPLQRSSAQHMSSR